MLKLIRVCANKYCFLLGNIKSKSLEREELLKREKVFVFLFLSSINNAYFFFKLKLTNSIWRTT